MKLSQAYPRNSGDLEAKLTTTKAICAMKLADQAAILVPPFLDWRSLPVGPHMKCVECNLVLYPCVFSVDSEGLNTCLQTGRPFVFGVSMFSSPLVQTYFQGSCQEAHQMYEVGLTSKKCTSCDKFHLPCTYVFTYQGCSPTPYCCMHA